jgi:hypothetical protein
MSAANGRLAASGIASSNDYSNLPKTVGNRLRVSISLKHVPTNRSLGHSCAPHPAHVAPRHNAYRDRTLTTRPVSRPADVNARAYRRSTPRSFTAYGISGSSPRSLSAASTISTGLPSSTSRTCRKQRAITPRRKSYTTNSRLHTSSSPSLKASSYAARTTRASGELSYSHCCCATRDIYTQRGWKWGLEGFYARGYGAATTRRR